MVSTEKGHKQKNVKSGNLLCRLLFKSFFGPITPLKLAYTFKTDVPQISQIHQNWTPPFDTQNDRNEQFLLIVS